MECSVCGSTTVKLDGKSYVCSKCKTTFFKKDDKWFSKNILGDITSIEEGPFVEEKKEVIKKQSLSNENKSLDSVNLDTKKLREDFLNDSSPITKDDYIYLLNKIEYLESKTSKDKENLNNRIDKGGLDKKFSIYLLIICPIFIGLVYIIAMAGLDDNFIAVPIVTSILCAFIYIYAFFKKPL